MYLLVDKKQLDERGIYPYAEILPDGRAILPIGVLKTISGLTNVDFLSANDIKELKKTLAVETENNKVNNEEEEHHDDEAEDNVQPADEQIAPGIEEPESNTEESIHETDE